MTLFHNYLNGILFDNNNNNKIILIKHKRKN
jgi:hypothetical protein